MKNIKADSFHGREDLQQLVERVNDFKCLFADDMDSIKNHKCYFVIKDRYEELMNKFDIRLKNIAIGADVSMDEVDAILAD